jgi:hypothetical protein
MLFNMTLCYCVRVRSNSFFVIDNYDFPQFNVIAERDQGPSHPLPRRDTAIYKVYFKVRLFLYILKYKNNSKSCINL